MLDDPLVKKAIEFSRLSLAGKKRYSGELFEDHCLKVAKILERYKITDPTTLSAAILHHSLKEGAATVEDLKKEFGDDIAEMIVTLESLSVIKITDIDAKNFAENLRRMFLVLAKDLRIVLIKLADILDNLKTLEYLRESKRVEISKTALEIFAPLAERLGMGEMKGDIQDLAFAQLNPEEYQRTVKILEKELKSTEETLLKIRQELKQILQKERVHFRLEGRAKHVYSLYLKLKRSENDFDISRIHDIIAFRVIVDTTEECYRVLGIIHKLWRPLPDRIKDYIANPKPNGYQSIHTTIVGPDDQPFELQIRTEQMHQDAEYGIAAHWHYSEQKVKVSSKSELNRKAFMTDDRLEWVKKLSDWQEEISDNEEFLKTVKTDFFGERIFVFTPKGEIKDLPIGATPVDFAYKVHSDLGNKATGARVNEKWVPLNTKLKNGDVCELMVSKDPSKKPNKDWLRFVVTAEARKRIKKATSES